VTVYQDADHPSHIDLPVIGTTAWRDLLGSAAVEGGDEDIENDDKTSRDD
jgi:hypothetical protein